MKNLILVAIIAVVLLFATLTISLGKKIICTYYDERRGENVEIQAEEPIMNFK